MNTKQSSPDCKSKPSQAFDSVMTAGKITTEIKNQTGKKINLLNIYTTEIIKFVPYVQ